MFKRSILQTARRTFTRNRRFHTSSLLNQAANNSSRSKFHLVAGFLLATGTGIVVSEYLKPTTTAKACGIIAVTAKPGHSIVNYLTEGLTILQNRGYDSAGIATISSCKTSLVVTKHASVDTTSDSIDKLAADAPSRHGNDIVGIAHTRWATHGGKTDYNAHPHCDYKQRIALVHNGTIENFDELKQNLIDLGIPFVSETDSEVIANLIGHYLDEGHELLQAVELALARLEGTWGLAIISTTNPDQIIAARNGSPLVIGLGEDCVFIASETSAFYNHTKEYIPLHDGEIAVVPADGAGLSRNRVQKAVHDAIELSPKPYEHWTVKEIYEQPAAIFRTLGNGSRITDRDFVKLGGLQLHSESLLPIQNLLIAACGTSLYAAKYGARIMRLLRAFITVTIEDAAEMIKDGLPSRHGGVCVVSQSGETRDTLRALTLAQNNGLPVLAVVNQVGSLIATTADCGVYLNAGREHAVASTKAFVTQVTALCLIACWFSQARQYPFLSMSNYHEVPHEGYPRQFVLELNTEESTTDQKSIYNLESYQTEEQLNLVKSLKTLPDVLSKALTTHDQVKKLAGKFLDKSSLFVLGKGFAEPIAYEAALKIKEITYIHAEGFSGGALKHGPFALLEEGTPVILIILQDEHLELMRIAAQEVRARGAAVTIVTDCPSALDRLKIPEDHIIAVPNNGCLSALGAILPLQLLAYEIAIQKGINPDKPRNLAKAVTVD